MNVEGGGGKNVRRVQFTADNKGIHLSAAKERSVGKILSDTWNSVAQAFSCVERKESRPLLGKSVTLIGGTSEQKKQWNKEAHKVADKHMQGVKDARKAKQVRAADRKERTEQTNAMRKKWGIGKDKKT